jgi:hypothetical protein
MFFAIAAIAWGGVWYLEKRQDEKNKKNQNKRGDR